MNDESYIIEQVIIKASELHKQSNAVRVSPLFKNKSSKTAKLLCNNLSEIEQKSGVKFTEYQGKPDVIVRYSLNGEDVDLAIYCSTV